VSSAAAAPATVEPPREGSLARFWPYAAVLAVAAPVRLWAAVADQGLFWPDEIYQSLEQAHRFAFGNGLIPWEFQEGARSWLFPGLIGLLWKVAHALGVRDALSLIVIAKVAVVAVGLCGIALAMRFAERLAGVSGALIAGALCAAMPAMVVYAARCMTETVSGPLLIGAALLVLEGGGRRAQLAGLLAGASVFFRYQNGLVTAGLLVVLLVQRRNRDALQYALFAAAVGLAGGALDWVTWGQPFHSFALYLKFNLIEGKAANWGTSPIYYYLQTAWSAAGPLALLIPVGLAFAWPRARAYVVLVLAYVLAHALVPHKEYRFLVPILPLCFALVGAGLAGLLERLRLPRSAAPLLAAAVVVLGTRTAVAETFTDMGQYLGSPAGARSVWHADEDVNRVLLAAGRRADLCGIVVAGIHPAWMGGYTYLNRDVPIYFRAGQSEAQGSNYIAAPAGARLPADWTEVLRHGRFALFHREGGCTPRPASWKPILP